MKYKHLIDDIVIILWSSWEFVSIESIKRKFNSIVDFENFSFTHVDIPIFNSFMYKISFFESVYN